MLDSTPAFKKHQIFDEIFPTFDELYETFEDVPSLSFAPGLLEAFKPPSAPSWEFFTSLPTARNSSSRDYSKCLCVDYMITMEMDGEENELYCGEASNAYDGHKSRMRNYKDSRLLPKFVKESLVEGYRITYIGLLVWIEMPNV